MTTPLPVCTRLICCLALFFVPALAQAQLLSPEAFLGYPLGSRFTPHHRVADYVRHVAERSDRVTVETFGVTYEDRPLLLATVTSAGNHQRLEEIRRTHLAQTGLDGTAAGAADGAVAVVWLSYGIHGNESVSTEAALLTLYHLVSRPEGQRWLENTVVLLDPCLNPDGRERYVHWYQQTVGYPNNADPDAWEHHEPWPRGRSNHYLFDLNRDWAWQIQRESQARHAAYQRWLPHVHADFHEMGAEESYFFAPSARPIHADVTPWQQEFQRIIGRNHARYFDQEGWPYFTREVYDLFYPSYGDTWPTLHGAIGMTYEQGGSGRAGLAYVLTDGDTLTLGQRLAHHYTTGLSTVEAAATHAARLNQEFARYFTARPATTYQSYLLRGDTPQRRQLLDYLTAQRIRWGYAGRAVAVRSGYDYQTGRPASLRTESGDVVVPADQPYATLVKTLFEPRTRLSDSLTYDITAWALPYAYGVEAYATADRLTAGATTAPPPPAPAAAPTDAPYAYLLPWQHLDDARLAAELLRRGVRPRYATEPFTTQGKRYGAGTLVVMRDDNRALAPTLDTLLRNAAARHHRLPTAVASGWVEQGSDLGSDRVRRMAAPRVAVLAGPEVSSLHLGEVWHYFERQINYPVTLLPTGILGQADLWKYDVLVLPEGNYHRLLDEGYRQTITRWVRDGGRLVVMGGATQAFVDQEGYGLAFQPQDTLRRQEEKKLANRLRPYGDRDRAQAGEQVLGAVLRTQLDTTHPLAFGYTGDYYTLKVDTLAYTYLTKGWNVGVLREDAALSGFTGRRARPKTRQALVFGVQPLGQGSVVYLVDNPLFRGFWHQGKLLFSNAVFFDQ